MRLVTGAMSSANRSPSASSTTGVAAAAGRPDVSRGNSVFERPIPSPLLVLDRGRPVCDGELTAARPTLNRMTPARQVWIPQPRAGAGEHRLRQAGVGERPRQDSNLGPAA